jgi:transcriptional regulator with PAS, ATPase and Fis domain
VREGKFREDLYYRLNVFSITAPPLRDRTEDIPLLVWSFVQDLEGSMGKTIEKIPKKSLDALQKYTWPGNIRQLKNLVENAMIISKNKLLKIHPPTVSTVTAKKSLKLEDIERKHIKDVLKATSWRISGKYGAAEILGLKRTTLTSKMKKLGLTRPI